MNQTELTAAVVHLHWTISHTIANSGLKGARQAFNLGTAEFAITPRDIVNACGGSLHLNGSSEPRGFTYCGRTLD